MNRKNIFFWTLYDFANSIAIIVFFLYFSEWLVIDHGVSDFWYNMIYTIGSILLIATAPVLGSIADKTHREQKYLNIITIGTFICFTLTSLVTLFLSKSVLLAAAFYLIANYCYQFSFVFYNAMLEKIATKDKVATISGLGQAANWIGQMIGLIITIPLATGAIYLFGESGRAQPLLPATIIFFILALPLLIWLKLPKREPELTTANINFINEYKSQWQKFKELVGEPNMGLFLLAYFFFNDAIITTSNNFPIYLENVIAVKDDTKSLLLIGILLTSAIGAYGGGWIADRIGLKKTLMIILSSWVVIFPSLGFVHDFTIFVILTVLMGTFFGATWTVTRATMVALCPPEKLNYGFSFYTLAERVSTLIGPLTWGIIASSLTNLGPTRYRIAIFSMGIFAAIGLMLMKKIKLNSEKIQSPN